MARGDKLARQWHIIQAFVSFKYRKSVSELVRDKNYRPRTVYRDMEPLQAAGFPIFSERTDGKGILAGCGGMPF